MATSCTSFNTDDDVALPCMAEHVVRGGGFASVANLPGADRGADAAHSQPPNRPPQKRQPLRETCPTAALRGLVMLPPSTSVRDVTGLRYRTTTGKSDSYEKHSAAGGYNERTLSALPARPYTWRLGGGPPENDTLKHSNRCWNVGMKQRFCSVVMRLLRRSDLSARPAR
jgi:hypothetical protein